MINEEVMAGDIKPGATLKGQAVPGMFMRGRVSVGGSMLQNAVLYVEQNLTDEQIEQARANIRVIGKDVAGMVFAPSAKWCRRSPQCGAYGSSDGQ